MSSSSPYMWPPDTIDQEYMQFHVTRCKQFYGRMRVLHEQPHPRQPRQPAKKKHRHGNPMAYVRAHNKFFPASVRKIIVSLKEHNLGMRLPSYDAVGVVYAIFYVLAGHQQESRVYVGITHRTVKDRFEEHIRQARDYRAGLRILDGDAIKLYGRMAELGVASCYIVPLQTIEGVHPAHTPEFYAAAKRYERNWIRILNSRDAGFNSYIPGGQNTLFSSFLGAFQGCIASLWHPVRSLYQGGIGRVGGFGFHYRDYVRRFQKLHERADVVGPQGRAAVIATMRRQNIERMIMVASLHSIQNVPPDEQGSLVATLQAHLELRVQNQHRKGKRASKLFVPFFESILMDDMPLQKILANAASASLLPIQMRHVHVMLGFRYSKPIGRRWYNYERFVTEHTYEQLQQIAAGPCDCHLPKYDRFKVPGCTHLSTCSSDFLRQEFPHLPALADIWDRGAKYRPHSYPIDTAQHRADVMHQLSGTMTKFQQRMSKQFQIPEHTLTPWCSDVITKMQASLADLGAPSYVQLGPGAAPVYGSRERAAMDSLLDKYVCTPTDKLQNNMCLVCKKCMAEFEVNEMEQDISAQDATYAVEHRSPADIFEAAQAMLEECQMEYSDLRLPFCYPMPKLHKPQLACRFITACSKFYLKHMAVWVSHLMRSLEVDIRRIWRQLHFPANLRFGSYPPWMIRNSAELIPLIRRFNMSQNLQAHDSAPPCCYSYDFERLFTKIRQHELKDNLSWLFDQVWCMRDKPIVRIRKGMCPRWRYGHMPQIRTGRDEGSAFYTFDLVSAKAIVNFLIDNAFLTVGDKVFRQVRGIPMGVSPAMYMANFYLFTCEFKFMQDALQALSLTTDRLNKSAIREVIRSFQYVARFADDKAVINRLAAACIERLFYVDQTYAGLHGIYPTSLRLQSSTVENAQVLRFLDVEVKPAHEVSGPLVTRLYDKRRQPQFEGLLRVMRFPAADSMLAWSCKLNVFDSQFVRFTRIITDVDNFQAEVVLLLVEMIRAGYPHRDLMRRCRRRCDITPVLFGVARGTQPVITGRPPRGLYPHIKARVVLATPGLSWH